MRRIFVVVTGGGAEVCGETVPPDVTVEVIDLDNLRENREETLSYLSPEARAYLTKLEEWHECPPSTSSS